MEAVEAGDVCGATVRTAEVCRGNGGAVPAAMEESGAKKAMSNQETAPQQSGTSFGWVKVNQIRPTRFHPDFTLNPHSELLDAFDSPYPCRQIGA